MLQRRDGEFVYQLPSRLDAAIARGWDEDEFNDDINPDCSIAGKTAIVGRLPLGRR